MLDAIGLTLHSWLPLLWASIFLLLLATWATQLCISSQQHQVSPHSRWWWRRLTEARYPGHCTLRLRCIKKTRVSGCGAKVFDAHGRSLGQFLCYDLSCVQCRDAAQERRRRQLRAVRRSHRTAQRQNSPSSPGCRHHLGHSRQRILLPRHRRKPHKDLHTADRGGGRPLGVADPHPVSRLELGEDFRKRLQAHMQRKCRQIHLGMFPALVQWSYKSSVHRTVPLTLQPSSSDPVYLGSPEASFLLEETQEVLEHHLRAEKLNHDWDLPGKSMGSAPREHRVELDGRLHCAPCPRDGEPEVEEGHSLPLCQTTSSLDLSQLNPKSLQGRTGYRGGREASGHQDSS